jgi:AAA domain
MAGRYLKNIKITNHRGVENLTCDEFSLLTVIGGLNGAGKTTLLESIFTIVDRYNPTTLLRPAIWRGFPPTIEAVSSLIFTHGARDRIITIDASTCDGQRKLEFLYEVQPQPAAQLTSVNQRSGDEATTARLSPQTGTSNLFGITHKVYRNGVLSDVRRLIDTAGGVMMNAELVSDAEAVPGGAYLSKATLNLSVDHVSRLTMAIQQKVKSRILQAARIISPIHDLQILQFGGQPQVCGEI